MGGRRSGPSKPLADQVPGLGEGGEIVRHDRHFRTLDLGSADDFTFVGQVASRAGIFHQGAAEPQGDETLIGKLLPSAFHGTGLEKHLQELGSLDLIVCGFMSHSSVSTTVRAAKNLGFRCTLVEDACATRDLPYKGGILSAEHVQQTEMAIMADNFATLALAKDLI